MRRFLPLALLALAPVAASAQESERPSKAVPSVGKALKTDGVTKDCTGLPLKSVATEGASASFTAKVGWRKDVLFVCVDDRAVRRVASAAQRGAQGVPLLLTSEWRIERDRQEGGKLPCLLASMASMAASRGDGDA